MILLLDEATSFFCFSTNTVIRCQPFYVTCISKVPVLEITVSPTVLRLVQQAHIYHNRECWVDKDWLFPQEMLLYNHDEINIIMF